MMSPEEVSRAVRSGLEEIDVPALPWVAARPEAVRRLRHRHAKAGAALAASAAVIAVALTLAAVTSGGAAAPGSAAAGGRPGASRFRTEPVLATPRVTRAMAAERGFLVYLSGKSLVGVSISADRIAAGNATWPLKRNEVMLAASKPGQAFWSPAVNSARTEVAYVEAPAAQIGRFDGQGDIAVSPVTGGHPRVLTTSGTDSDPQWSPDGKQIAFLRDGSIWLMRADGAHQHPLGVALQANTVAWAPSGTELAVGSGSGPERIAIISIRHRTFRWFTPHTGVEQYDPAWSPDGKQLVYGQTGPNALFISNLNGSGTRQLTFCKPPRCTQDVEPAWSPDGAEIAFVRSVYGVQQIAVVPAQGGPVHYLTSGPYQHNLPSW